ncbi:MAG: hypothetical protein AB8C13_03445 [Phycisphaerales bacterium]
MSMFPNQHKQIQQEVSAGQLDLRAMLSDAVMMAGATAWGGSLAVVGVWILFDSGLPGFLAHLSTPERLLSGLGMLCGGQLIFLLFVASRLFQRAPRMMTLSAHWGLLCAGALCFGIVVFGRVFGGGLA